MIAVEATNKSAAITRVRLRLSGVAAATGCCFGFFFLADFLLIYFTSGT